MFRSTSFIFSRLGLLSLGSVLALSSGVSAQVFDTVINLPADGEIEDFEFIVDGTQVNVLSEGFVGSDVLADSGSEVNVSGGTVGEFFTTSGDVNISGGTVGEFFKTFGNVNISGGSVGFDFIAEFGSEVNISGGAVSGFFTTFGEVNISGGTVGDGFSAFDGSEVNITGGSVGDFFAVDFGSVVNISCLLYTSPSPRDRTRSRMPSSA